MPVSLGTWLERKLVKTWPLVVFHTCWICYGSTRWKPECLETSTLQPRGVTKLVIAGGCAEKTLHTHFQWCFTKWLIQPTYCNKTCSSTLDISRSYPQQIPRLPFTISAPPPLLSSWLVVHLPVFGTKPCREKNKFSPKHRIISRIWVNITKKWWNTPYWHEKNII